MIIIVFPFIIRTLINQKLGAEYLGLSSLFKSVLTMLSLAELGFSSAIVFSMYKPIALGDKDQINSLLNFYRKTYIIIGLIILIIGLCIIPFLPHFMNGTAPADINIYAIYLIYLANTVVSYFLSAYKESLLVAHQKVHVSQDIISVCYLAMYSLQILAVVIFKNYYLYSLIILFITIVINIVRSIIVKRMYPEYECRGELSEETKNDLKKRILGLLVYKISEVCRNSFDSIILSSFLGLVVLANYQNYYYIMTAVISIFTLISNAIIASIGNSIAVETKAKNHADFIAILLLYGWIASWCSCCLACLYQPFMKIWMGTESLFEYKIVLLFCIYFFVLSIANVCFTYRQAAGLWWEDRVRPVAEAVSNLLLDILLVKRFGAAGILLASITTIVFLNIPLSIRVLFKHYFEMSTKSYWKHLYYIGLFGVISGLAAYGICSRISFTGWPEIIAKGLICVIVPNIILLFLYNKLEGFKRSKEIISNMIPMKIRKSFMRI
ncbi:MAG: hypothetical protein IJI14_09880 [Anaerolineaceae bacterium]|nr:hypothetical protein [Anaerolineaceae bacterium]